MKKVFISGFSFLILLFLLSFNIFAQESIQATQISHGEVLISTLISAGFNATYLCLTLFYNLDSNSISYDLLDFSLFMAVLPMYFYNLPLALVFTATSLSLYFISDFLWRIDEDVIAQAPANGFMDFSFFTTYAIYRDKRKIAKTGIYNANWRQNAFGNSPLLSFPPYIKDTVWKPYTFIDLAIAPFNKANLSDMLLYTIIPAGLIAPFLQHYLAYGNFENSVFTTGKAFIGIHEFPALLGVPMMAALLYMLCTFVAIGEDSLFRGVLYEELGATYNQWVAKITDMIVFPLFHVPAEIEFYQENPGYFFNYFIRRALLTFIIDLTYDRGGLSRSVAFHFWVDFTQLFAYYLINGGVAQDDFSDIMGMFYPKIEIQFAFSF